jgi:hypothetical protein
VDVVVIPTLAPHAQLLLLPAVLILLRDRSLVPRGLISRLLLSAAWAVLAWPWMAALGLLLARLWVPAQGLLRFWQVPLYTSPIAPLAVLAARVGLARNTLETARFRAPGREPKAP